MSLPFTEGQFLDNFAAFNTALWPVLVALWIATLILGVQLVLGRPRSAALGSLLAVQWVWAGVAYHAMFFTRINPAAWLFAAFFVAQAMALLWYSGATHRLTFTGRRSVRHAGAVIFITYALLYPAVVQLTGHQAPRAPTFGVPCPTVLFTAGLLLAAEPPVSRWLLVIPAAWSVVAGSAAFLLRMPADWMLFAAAAALVADGLFAPGRTARSRASLAERARPRAVDR